MDFGEIKLKNYFALKIKLKGLHVLRGSFLNKSKFHLKVFYENEDENEVTNRNERAQVIEIPETENFYMIKVDLKKKLYLPIICQNGWCPNFIHIICTNDRNTKMGLRLYLNDYYSFLKYYTAYKSYKLFKLNSCDEKGKIELAIDLISCKRPFGFFGKKNENDPMDYYTLSTKVSISKLKIDMLQNKNDKDYDMHIQSFPVFELLELTDTNKPNTNNLINLFKILAKSSYEQMPIPLITAAELFDVICLEIFPYHRQNNQKPYWVKITNDAYDLCLYNHFQCYSKNAENHIYEEIKTCSLFFYLESIFTKIAATFAKSVIINEYTKFTSFRYVDTLFSKKEKRTYEELFENQIQYANISGLNSFENIKLFKNDELYMTTDVTIIKEGLIGVLIRGDEETDIEKAYKIYNCELKAQQWLNKGIARLKIANFQEWKKKAETNKRLEKIPLSCLSFSLSTIVSYKGFKMFVIPCPYLPLVKTELSEVSGNLKYELKLLEKLIPTYELFQQDSKNSPIFIQYHSESNFVFHKVHVMMHKSKKKEFFLFDSSNSKIISSGNGIRDDFYSSKSFYSNFLKGREEINLYLEMDEHEEKQKKGEKSIDVHLQEVVKEIESLSFHVPFDSVSLKTFLHSKGIRMRHIGRMLKFVTFKWLYTMLHTEIVIRCIKHFVFCAMRELCLFYKNHILTCLLEMRQKYGKGRTMCPREINNLIRSRDPSVITNDHMTNYVGTYSAYDETSSSSSQSSVCSEDKSKLFSNTSSSNKSNRSDFSDSSSDRESDSESESESESESDNVSSSENKKTNTIAETISKIYGNIKNLKNHGLSSKKKALKSFLNISKILRDNRILENRLGCNFSLARKLLNFERYKKYENIEMLRLKLRKKGIHKVDIFNVLKKKYRGNMTLVDMFIINVFNLILTENYYKEIFLTTVITNICVKIFKIRNFKLSLDLPYNYIYENLQNCFGISLFPSLSEYTKIRKANEKFHLFHLKIYNCKVKRSVNIMYLDLQIYKYIQNSESIHLNTCYKNKQILSHLIVFTIIHHHHLNVSNKTTVERLLMHEKEIRDKRKSGTSKDRSKNIKHADTLKTLGQMENKNRLEEDRNHLKRVSDYRNSIYNKTLQNSYKRLTHISNFSRNDAEMYNSLNSNSKPNISWIYDVKLNSLLSSKDIITAYNVTDYLTFYGLLNIIGLGIKFHFFKTALRISSFAFQYISEDHVISVHFRLMWLAMYACKKWTYQYFMKPPNWKDYNDNRYINFLYTQQSYYFEDTESEIDDSIREYGVNSKGKNRTGKYDSPRFKKSNREYKHGERSRNLKNDNNNNNNNNNNDDDNNDTDDNDELKSDDSHETDDKESIDDFLIDSDYLTNERNCDYFFHYKKTDVYKKTYQTCSTILNDYFVYLHPLHLDFFLALAWCNKSAKNYREFLFLIRTVLLLQTRMSLKNSREEKMKHVKLSDDFDSIIYSAFSKDLNDDKFTIEEPDKRSYFFLNDICYAHETTFLKENIKLIPRTNSFYNIRLAYTLHYFANSLFYYYNTNKIIKTYKSKDFILNNSLYCIKILEHAKSIFQFFNAKNVNIAKVSIDVSLMVLKLIFSDKSMKSNSVKMMTYALNNVKTADKILRETYGINHIDSLYCNYVLSLIYMYLNRKNCIYTFEEIIYYLLNYNYIYSDKNIVSEIFWYFPEHIVTLRCIDGIGFLETNNIKCYLFNIYLNIFIPNEYIKKIVKILMLSYTIDFCKNKKNVNFFDKSSYLYDSSYYSKENVLGFLRGYKRRLSKTDLFEHISDYEELLKNNKRIKKSEKKITKEKLNEVTTKSKTKVGHFYDHSDFVSQTSCKDAIEKEMKNFDEFWCINKNNDYILKNENKKVKNYKSITAMYLKGLIKQVELEAEYLYEESKNKRDLNKQHRLRQSHIYTKIINLKNIGIGNVPKVLDAKQEQIPLDNSTVGTISVFNSDESSSADSYYSDIISNSSINSSIDEKKYKKSSHTKSIHFDNTINNKSEEMIKNKSEKDNNIVYTNIDVLMSVLYYFLNTSTLEKVYREKN